MLTLAGSLVALCIATELLDPFARPRRGGRWRPRSLLALPFRLGPTLFVFGVALCLVGRPAGAAPVAIVLLVAVVAGSNVKRRILGEPLLFTDAAVVGEMLRHPGFYVGAIAPAVRLALVVVLGAIGWLLLRSWTGVLLPRLAGAGLALCCWPALDRLARAGPWGRLMTAPAVEADVALHGLLATVSLYWLRWRRQPDPLPLPEPAGHGSGADALVLVVQCESFADPCALGPAVASRAPPLPGLARARARAVRWGRLAACGFGAYTMRTEYGVLFGREEDELGFRRFDPFLTAARDRSAALPMRLRGRIASALFVHPHDLGFYGRDRLMPAIGFTTVFGASAFPEAVRRGPHVGDAALGDRLEALVAAAAAPTLIYAVTIENHGPWKAGRLDRSGSGLDAYLDHLVAGDALLARLIDLLDARGRPAVLAFFGDHRPSIPGTVEPGGDRDTPFVLLRFGSRPDGAASGVGAEPERLTPAGLHHAILREAASLPA